jgi:ubiquinone/menaquinone biosynthesis C-methylase UbiE
VGCGSGVTTIKLAEWIKGEIVGLDIDNKSLKSLKKGYNQRDLVIESKQFGARSWEINLMVFP